MSYAQHKGHSILRWHCKRLRKYFKFFLFSLSFMLRLLGFAWKDEWFNKKIYSFFIVAIFVNLFLLLYEQMNINAREIITTLPSLFSVIR